MATSDTKSAGVVLPKCLGMIMDGNRRWARARGRSTVDGHKAGYEKFKEVADWCKEKDGIDHLVVYAFSSENWNRNDKEVGYLMKLMRELLKKGLPEMHKHDVAVHIVGDRTRFPEDIQHSIEELHANNPEAAVRHAWVCASYGGRDEILAATRTLLAQGVSKITEDALANALWTKGMPDPDLIVRTGGQERLSNFLTWQSTYSELFFTETLWPDLSREEFEDILNDFVARKRNYGK